MENIEKKVRHLKLQPIYRQSRTTFAYNVVPELRLRGNWLKRAGFTPDSSVSVTVKNGLLIIRLHDK